MERLIIVNRIDDAPVNCRQWIEPPINKKTVMMIFFRMMMMTMSLMMMMMKCLEQEQCGGLSLSTRPLKSRQWIKPGINKKI